MGKPDRVVMKYKPAFVKWIDITTKNGWISQDEADEFIMNSTENIVYQCGFVYEEDENQIVLLNSFFDNQDLLGDLTKIPKATVIEIKYL